MPSENSNIQYLVTKAELDEVAAAIQAKAGLSNKLHWPTEMASAIMEIEGGASFNFSGVNVTSDKMIQNTTAWNNRGIKITGNIPEQLASQIDDVLISPSHMTRHTSSNWGNTSPQFSSGYYPESHQAEIQYDYSQAWEITPSTEDKTYYLLNTDDFNYANQPNRSNVTNFNSNAFPYAITVKSAPASGSTIDWTGGGAINISADKVLTNTYFYNTEGELTTGVIPIKQSNSALFINLIDPGDLNEDGTFIGIRNFSAGYYAGPHANAFKIASSTQSSIISIDPSSTSQTITLFGGDATYSYFPKAITITSVSNNGSSGVSEDIATRDAQWLEKTLPNELINSQISYVASSACVQMPITRIDFPNCQTISNSAFYGCTNLTTVSIPLCTNIGSTAFEFCRNLKTINMSAVVGIGNYAFAGAFQNSSEPLITINIPECTGISLQAFSGCSMIEEVVGNKIAGIDSYAFQNCINLKSIDLTKLSKINTSTFYHCDQLNSINLLNCTSIAAGAFQNCSSLTSISLPVCQTVNNSAFIACYALEEINLPACTSLGSNAFKECRNLRSVTMLGSNIYSSAFCNCFNLMNLTLTASTVVRLQNSNVFNSTPIRGYRNTSYYTGPESGFGSIYVPASLYDSYIVASYWSLISNRIVAI